MDYLKTLTEEFKLKNYYYFKNLIVKEIEGSIVVIEFDYQRRVSNKFKNYTSTSITSIYCDNGHCKISIKKSNEALEELLKHLSCFVWGSTGW